MNSGSETTSYAPKLTSRKAILESTELQQELRPDPDKKLIHMLTGSQVYIHPGSVEQRSKNRTASGLIMTGGKEGQYPAGAEDQQQRDVEREEHGDGRGEQRRRHQLLYRPPNHPPPPLLSFSSQE